MTELTNVKLKSKVDTSLPKGAKLLNKEVDISVEQIENGFLICKRVEMRFTIGDRTDYKHYSQKFFSETNPLMVEPKADKTLASIFD